MTDPLFWIGLGVGLFAGGAIGMFATALMLATRDERNNQWGHYR